MLGRAARYSSTTRGVVVDGVVVDGVVVDGVVVDGVVVDGVVVCVCLPLRCTYLENVCFQCMRERDRM